MCIRDRDETEARWNGATARVFRGAGDGEPMEIQSGKRVIHQHLAARGREPVALVYSRKPVAERRTAIQPINAVIAGNPDDAAIEQDRRLDVVIVFRLLHHIGDELPDIRDRARAVEPRKPLAQVRAIGLDHGEEFLRVAQCELAEAVPVIQAMEKHGGGDPRSMPSACETESKCL